jgi:hypothetical protein
MGAGEISVVTLDHPTRCRLPGMEAQICAPRTCGWTQRCRRAKRRGVNWPAQEQGGPTTTPLPIIPTLLAGGRNLSEERCGLVALAC